MGRGPSAKVLSRMCAVLEVLERELGGVATMSEIVRALERRGVSVTHSQVYYALRRLMLEGKVRRIGRGRLTYWCLANLSEEEVMKRLRQKNGAESTEHIAENSSDKPRILELLQFARDEVLAELMRQYQANPDLYDKLRKLDELLTEAVRKLRQTLHFSRFRS